MGGMKSWVHARFNVVAEDMGQNGFGWGGNCRDFDMTHALLTGWVSMLADYVRSRLD